MDLGEIGLGGVDWIRLAQDRDQWQAVVSIVMNLWVLVLQSKLLYQREKSDEDHLYHREVIAKPFLILVSLR
jgi:hypothetical protein